MIQNFGACSPSAADHFKKYKTCLTHSELRTLAHAYNKIVKMYNSTKNKKTKEKKESEEDHIIYKEIPLHKFKSFKMLYNALNERFSKVCGMEKDQCWIEQDIFKKNYHDLYQYLSKNFRPVMKSSWVKNQRELLETFDILKVMKQYEAAYGKFSFLGVFPMDFMKKKDSSQCIVGEICKIDLVNLFKKGKSCIGLVLNFDPHDQPGSHWVACFADFDPDSPKYGFFIMIPLLKKNPERSKNFTKL